MWYPSVTVRCIMGYLTVVSMVSLGWYSLWSHNVVSMSWLRGSCHYLSCPALPVSLGYENHIEGRFSKKNFSAKAVKNRSEWSSMHWTMQLLVKLFFNPNVSFRGSLPSCIPDHPKEFICKWVMLPHGPVHGPVSGNYTPFQMSLVSWNLFMGRYRVMEIQFDLGLYLK